MTKESVTQNPSETALFAALRRTLANKAYKDEQLGPDDLAVIFLPAHFRFFLRFGRIRANTRRRLDDALPGLTEYMMARTAFFDRAFGEALRAGMLQIVLLGAGYDSRAYRFAALNRGTRIFELDIAPTQERKRACLRKARIEIPAEVAFVPIDFNRDSLRDVLAGAGYRPDRPALFIWEGVTYYLEAESVDATLAFVREGAHPDSAIAFDYAIAVPEEAVDDFYGAREFARTMKERHAGEALLFSIAEGDAASFLEHRGLRLLEHLDNEALERTFLRREDGPSIGRVTAHFRIVSATPGDDGERSAG